MNPKPIITDAPSLPQAEQTANPSSPPLSTKRLSGLRLAAVAGVLLWLAHPSASLWPLAWVALAPLVVGITRATRFRQALWRGYLFGCVFLGLTWYWTGLTIAAWTHSAVGWVAWLLLTMILAWFYGLWGAGSWWLLQRTTGQWRIVAPAALWVVMEWARTVGSLTMPWAQLSYSQYRFLPLLQIADTTGAYGISFLVMLVNAALAYRWMHRKEEGSGQGLWAAGILTLFVCLYGAARLGFHDSGRPLPIAAMQGNFKSNDARESREQEFRTFMELTRQAEVMSPPPALYVWGESSSPGDALTDQRTYDFLRSLAVQAHAPLLIGSRVIELHSKLGNHWAIESNASVFFPPDSGKYARYNKQQLVPFGEFIPFRALLPASLKETFEIPAGDVTPGTETTILRFTDRAAGPVALGPFICYESMYPAYASSMTREGANLLVTQSNDDWFHSEAAMEQHLAAVVLRGIECRRDVVRSTTTGITCFIDSKGSITARAPLNATAILKRTALLRDGTTPYVRFGDWFVLACAAMVVLSVHKSRRKHWSEGERKPRSTRCLREFWREPGSYAELRTGTVGSRKIHRPG